MLAPTLGLKNQFGETTNNFIVGGSSQIWCNFIVDATNGNGLGIRSLKGFGVSAVYMHTSATPAASNPNPAVGYVVVQLSEPYQGYINGTYGFVSPVSGTPINVSSGLTIGQPYVIVSVGTSTAANWQALGLPVGIAPAVGVSFIATSSSAGTGTGVVEVPLATGAGVGSLQIIGDPNQTSSPSSGGAQIICQLLSPTNSSTTTPVATAPAAGTVIGMTFNMSSQTNEEVI